MDARREQRYEERLRAAGVTDAAVAVAKRDGAWRDLVHAMEGAERSGTGPQFLRHDVMAKEVGRINDPDVRRTPRWRQHEASDRITAAHEPEVGD